MKKRIAKIFNPNKLLGIPICIVSSICLIYVFATHQEGSPLSYIAYLLSAYAFILFTIGFSKACKFSNHFIKSTKLYHSYQKNAPFLLKISLIVSSTMNLIYGIFKLATGIYFSSWWFITFAVYYLILWLMKRSLIRNTKQWGENKDKEYKQLKKTGTILFLLNIVLIGMIILIIRKNQSFSYPGYFIYVIALYDFYLMITAIINVLKHKEHKSPIITASKCISLTVAMISMLSLEVAMIYQFGENDAHFKLVMTSCTGFGIVLINTIMVIFMWKKANQYLKPRKKKE